MSTMDITGRFYTAGVEHNVLAGWEYYGQFGSVKSISVDASPINIFRPIYSNVNLASQPYNFFIDQKTSGMVCIYRIRSHCSTSCISWQAGVMTGLLMM